MSLLRGTSSRRVKEVVPDEANSLQRKNSMLSRGAKSLRSSNVFVKAGKGAAKLRLTPLVFLFELRVESVEKISALGSVVVVWERGNNLLATKACKVIDGRATVEEMIFREVTLYSSGGEEGTGNYKEKLFKVAVRSSHANGKTLGKMRFDLSQYADYEAAERRLSLKLSNGSSIVVAISSKFIRSGKRSKRSRGGDSDSDAVSQSSMGSYLSSSDLDVDDLDDLDMDGLDDLESDIDLGSLSTASEQSMSTSHPSVALREVKSEDDDDLSLRPTTAHRSLQRKIDIARETINKLVEENVKLREVIGGSKSLGMENEVLRRQIEELKELLCRPPEADELVKELAEAKMLLAMESFEAEEVCHQASDLRKKLNAKKKFWSMG